MEERHLTYDSFSGVEWYRRVNRRLASISGIGPGDRVLDIGAGTGSSTAMILEQMNYVGEVIALDRNRAYLDAARMKLARFPNVRFVEADALEAGNVVHGLLEGAFVFNSIHLIENYQALLSAVSMILKPGGTLAFNSTYFTENDSDLRGFQSELLVEVVRLLMGRNRDFTRRERMYIRSAEEYREGAVNAGFDVVHREIADVAIEPESLVDFYRDGDVSSFIAADLSPEEIEGMIIVPLRGLLEKLKREEKTSLQNKWLYMVARKRLKT